jgi:phospholipid/cholesterol/gamma-HCH transport system permease protein
MCVLTGKAVFRFPFQWKEFILQCWFILRVALLPTMAVSVPVTALFIFTFNILLIQVGAADISGAGAGIAVITEIDAMEVLGIDPIHRLVVPRVLACALCGMLLNALVSMVGLVGGFLFGVYMQHVSAGAYLATLTLVTGLPEVVIATIKALAFGLIAGLVGCYRGLTVKGGSKGLGTAVNETVVLCVVALFAVNVVLTTIGVRFGTGM